MTHITLPSGEWLLVDVPTDLLMPSFYVEQQPDGAQGLRHLYGTHWVELPPGSYQLHGSDPLNLSEEEAAQVVGSDVCELCGGDGKETCNNPDHAFIDSMWGDTGRLGCPACGHDPKHKVKNGGPCFECNGTGRTPPIESYSSLLTAHGHKVGETVILKMK